MRSVPRTRPPSRTILSPLPSSRSSVAGTHIATKEEGHEFWSGTAADLLTALEETAAAQRIDVKAKSWPKAAHILMRRLNEVKSNLLDIGVQFESKRDGTTRQVTFRKCTESSVSSVSSVTDEQKQSVSTDATADATEETPRK